MNAIAKTKRVMGLMGLLCSLPLAAHALSDTIITDMLKLLALLLVGGVVALVLIVKVLTLFIKTLEKEEKPAVSTPAATVIAGQIVWPTAAAGGRPWPFRWGLAARVALLALLPNLFWLYQTFSLLQLHAGHPLATETTNLLLISLVYSLPSVILAGWLWKHRRPSMALGVMMSSFILAAGLLALTAGQRHKEAAAEQAIIDATPPPGPDATHVLDHADQMPTFHGGPDSLQANFHRRVHYPELPQADQLSGRVRLRYVVGIDGRVISPEVTQGLGGGAFDDEALRAVRELTFDPARQNGEIVAVYDTISVVFKKPTSHKGW